MKKRFISSLVTILAAALALLATACPDTNSPVVKDHTVTFASNGGSDVAAVTVKDGTVVAEPTAPTKAGYGFYGWFKDEACTQAWAFATDVVTADITLYAKWLPNPSVGAQLAGLSISGLPDDLTLSLSETWSLSAVLAGTNSITDYLWEDFWGKEELGYEKDLRVSGRDFWSLGTQWLRLTVTMNGVKYQDMVQLTVVRD